MSRIPRIPRIPRIRPIPPIPPIEPISVFPEPPRLPKHVERVELRASSDDLVAWKAAAYTQRMNLSDWIRRTCNAATGRVLAKKTKKAVR